MKLSSLSLKTDLIFSNFIGTVLDKGHYKVIKTPDNPNHLWGNYIIFDSPPKLGDLEKWTIIFEEEFSDYAKLNHMAFTWDSKNSGEYQEFTENCFEFNENIILSTNKIRPPLKRNDEITIKKIISNEQWEEVLQVQLACADQKDTDASFKDYKRTQISMYREMINSAMGFWFGAYLDGKIVANLGLFHEGQLARYQNVGTHPDYRRLGICQTLVYETALIAFNELGISSLVMEADSNYRAAKVYESVGFKPDDKSYSLTWCLNTR